MGALGWCGAWLVAAACGFQSSTIGAGDNTDGGLPGTGCDWATQISACALPVAPSDALTLTAPTAWLFDTHAARFVGASPPAASFAIVTMQQTGGPDIVVLYSAAFSLDAGATLAVIGDRPLVIASSSTLAIAGDLDAGSHLGGGGIPVLGPGANSPGCTSLGSLGGSGAGGGGGALGAAGGTGGQSDGSSGGRAGAAIALPATLRGGCAGGRGGKGAPAGNGGGGLALVAGTAIDVTGSINAGGSGGEGGTAEQAGGGGGGSGGIISFDAPRVTFAATAMIAANGGGGGGGSNDNRGGRGSDGVCTAVAASGGTSAASNIGGAGGAGTQLTGGAGIGMSDNGGGGGGGSVGYIAVHSSGFTSAAGAMVSPAATPR